MDNRVIHRFWSGPEMPERYRDYGRRWEELNPGWVLKDWTEEEVEKLGLRNAAVWDDISRNGGRSAIAHRPEVARATQLADVAAYEIIHRFGGVYVNCDMEPLRPLSKIPVTESDAWACTEVDHWINNGALGGPAGHPFWDLVIDELPRRWETYHDQPMHLATGPHLLTHVYQKNPDAGLVVLSQEHFNLAPIHLIPIGGVDFYERERIKGVAIELKAIAIHWWGHRFSEARTDV